MHVGHPRSEAVDDEDHVGVGDPRGRVLAHVHRVLGGDGGRDGPPLADGDRPLLGEAGERVEAGRRSRTPLGHDQGPLRRGQQLGHRLRLLRRGHDGSGLHRDGCGDLVARARLAQHLPRQAEVHRSLRRRGGDGVGPIEQLGHLLREPQLVVPLAGLAHEAGLVAHLLTPTDGHGPGTEPAPLDGRGAPGHQQERHVVGGGVDRADHAVGQPDVGVEDHRLGAAAGEVVAVGHAHRHVLVGYDDRPRQVTAVGVRLGEALDDRREVGARIHEHDVDTELAEAPEDRATCRDGQLVTHSSPPPPGRRRHSGQRGSSVHSRLPSVPEAATPSTPTATTRACCGRTAGGRPRTPPATCSAHLRPGLTLLDVGCGPGTITLDLAARVAPGRTIGVDASAEVIDQARASIEPRTGRRVRRRGRLPPRPA